MSSLMKSIPSQPIILGRRLGFAESPIPRSRCSLASVLACSLGDEVLPEAGNPKALTSYKSVAERGDLGVVAGTVQINAAHVRNEIGRSWRSFPPDRRL